MHPTRSSTIQELKERICDAFLDLNVKLCRKVLMDYNSRLTALAENGGAHLEGATIM